MKSTNPVLLIILVLGLGIAGCGKKEEPTPPTPPAQAGQPAVPPVPVTSPPATPAPAPDQPDSTAAMQLATDVKGDIDKAMALAKGGKYTEALALLQQRLAQVQSNPDQKKLLDDAIASVKKMMADAAATTGLSGLQKSLSK